MKVAKLMCRLQSKAVLTCEPTIFRVAHTADSTRGGSRLHHDVVSESRQKRFGLVVFAFAP